jgi:hypothetical protein
VPRQRCRRPDLSSAGELKAGWKNTDDLVGSIFDVHGATPLRMLKMAMWAPIPRARVLRERAGGVSKILQ